MRSSASRVGIHLRPPLTAGPLTQVVKKSLTITNSNSQPVAFKVKTTAPKQYCVRPNSGRIEAGERVEVQVLLQPFKEEPPTSAKCRDKFLVQSAVISADKETLPMTEFWALQEREKESIFEHKIRCAFLPPSSATVPEENETSEGAYDQQSALQRAKAAALAAGSATAAGAGAAYAAVKDQGSRAVTGAQEVVSPAVSSPTSVRSAGAEPPISIASLNGLAASPTAASTTYPATTTAVPAAAYTSSVPVTASSPQELEAEVQRLRAQLASQGGVATRSGAVAQKSSGVPVHIVAAIAVGVFAITYLFF